MTQSCPGNNKELNLYITEILLVFIIDEGHILIIPPSLAGTLESMSVWAAAVHQCRLHGGAAEEIPAGTPDQRLSLPRGLVLTLWTTAAFQGPAGADERHNFNIPRCPFKVLQLRHSFCSRAMMKQEPKYDPKQRTIVKIWRKSLLIWKGHQSLEENSTGPGLPCVKSKQFSNFESLISFVCST